MDTEQGKGCKTTVDSSITLRLTSAQKAHCCNHPKGMGDFIRGLIDADMNGLVEASIREPNRTIQDIQKNGTYNPAPIIKQMQQKKVRASIPIDEEVPDSINDGDFPD